MVVVAALIPCYGGSLGLPYGEKRSCPTASPSPISDIPGAGVCSFPLDAAMNRDQVKGKVKDVTGKAQQKLGEVTGSAEQQAKGVAKQIAGKTQKALGDIEEANEAEAKRTRYKP